MRFLGHIKDRNDLADLYANADFFVHPNPREPFGIAPLEAMASGLPLVAPNCGGVSSYANSENAWVTEAEADSFSKALQEAIADPGLTAEKARNARATAQRYSWESVAAAFLDLYDELHQARTNSACLGIQDTVSGADFYSTPAPGSESGLMHYVSQLAARSFRLASKVFPQSRERKFPPLPAEPVQSA